VLRLTCALLGVVVVAGAAPAQPGAEAREFVPVDPEMALTRLAVRYRTEPAHETVTVTVKLGAIERSEAYTLRLAPGAQGAPPRFELRMGDVIIWSTASEVRAVHRLDARAYASAPIEDDDVLGALERLAPPIPCPQLRLAMGDGELSSPLPAVQSVEWGPARILDEDGPGGEPASFEIEGTHGAGPVRLVATATDPVRLRRIEAALPGDAARMWLVVTPAGLAPGALGAPVEGRKRRSSMAELVPTPGDLRVGDPMPAMTLQSVGENEAREPAKSPRRVFVLARSWSELASAAMRAAEEAMEGRTGVTIAPVLVVDIGMDVTALPGRLTRAAEAAAPWTLWSSVSPGSTIERFDEHAPVVVVVERDGTIAGVTALENDDDAGAVGQMVRRALRSAGER